MKLNQTTWHRLIKAQHLLTPIAVDWMGLAEASKRRLPRAYRTLYIFGIRIATWRVDV